MLSLHELKDPNQNGSDATSKSGKAVLAGKRNIDQKEFLDRATRILFFTGKGGVGKTSLACSTAVALADRGKRVLLVSTDPASNLDEVLEVRLSGEPTRVPATQGLYALNIDPEAAARVYRERVIGPYKGVLPKSALDSMSEQLSGACTVEIASFDEFTKLLGDETKTANYDHVIFDTAPTGHTLRLLKLPAAWTGFIETNTTGTSCLGPLAGLQKQKEIYDASLRALSDPNVTTLILVSRPEKSALVEAERTITELSAIGMLNQILILNGVFMARDRHDQFAVALESRGRDALEEIPEALGQLPRLAVPLQPYPLMGVANLRAAMAGRHEAEGTASSKLQPMLNAPSLAETIDGLEKAGHGVILVMGKGGVGKTTIAAAIAIDLARRGHKVHLSTTDPAAHVEATVGTSIAGLSVSRINPEEEIRRYSEGVVTRSAPSLDPQARALLEEDLRSPCTEEIAVFSAFAETVARGEHGFVVLDTAPTGHSLLLLDAAEAYHRDVSRTQSSLPDSVRNLLPRLRDPEFTHVLLVTLPEATPVHEAAALQEDLRRAGIEPYGWIINQSFAGNGYHDAVLAERGRREIPFIEEVSERYSKRIALIAWNPEPPVGPERLGKLAISSNHKSGVNQREIDGAVKQ